jgi:hypothetical protein
MKKLLFLLFVSSSVFAQQHLSFNLGGAAVLNFNTPLQSLEQPYEAHSNYISPNVLAHISYDVKRSFLSLESSYHFRSYGFVIEFSEEDYNLRLIQKQNTETFSVQFLYNQYLHYSPKLKSHYYLTLGSGYSHITHVSTFFRKTYSGGFGYFKIDWEGAFEREDREYATVAASLGLSIKSTIRNIGPIHYGLRYNFDFKPTPYLSSEFEHNGKLSAINFQTQPHYVMAFLTLTLFDFEKQHNKWKWRRY